MKQYIIVFLLLVMMSVSLSGCAGNELMQEAQEGLQQFESTEPAKLIPDKENYGAVAYQYLEHIQNHFPGRIAGSEKEKEMAVFLVQALLEGGYEEEHIKIQDFEIDKNSAPVQAIEGGKAFDGGKNRGKSHNIEVVKKGTSEKTILVGAHYDSVGTHGIIDNGSGVSLVLENALRMVHAESPYTVRYVFFGAEEIGMCGSRAYVEGLSQEEKENLLFMVNVDCVAGGDAAYLYGGNLHSDGTVTGIRAVERAYETAQELGLEIQLPPEKNPDYPFPTGQKRSDFAPFSEEGIPYIYFESNNWETGEPAETEAFGVITHTEKDDLDFLNQTFPERAKGTLKTYSKLLCALLEADIAE